MSKEKVDELGIKPIAKLTGYADAAQAPEWFTTAPAKAIPKAIAKAGLTPSDIDYYEINEAFSVVALATLKELELDESKVNVNGGAIAIGHPLGISGTRIITTLLYEMIRRDAKKGVATMCIGGGQGIASLIERD